MARNLVNKIQDTLRKSVPDAANILAVDRLMFWSRKEELTHKLKGALQERPEISGVLFFSYSPDIKPFIDSEFHPNPIARHPVIEPSVFNT